MGAQTEPSTEGRVPLSRDRVLRAAVELADREGIAALTMRSLAHALGVEAMSLYYHVKNKGALLDGVVDLIVEEITGAAGQIDGPSAEDDWKAALRLRILAARQVLLRHPWAPGVIETRSTMSPAIVHHFESVLAVMREGGFSYDLAHHALHALGSRALGFTQELFAPDDVDGAEASDVQLLEQMAEQLPHLMAMMGQLAHDGDTTLGWCDDQAEFEFGLDLILDGLDRLRATP